MVSGGDWIYRGDRFLSHTNVHALCCTPAAAVTVCVSCHGKNVFLEVTGMAEHRSRPLPGPAPSSARRATRLRRVSCCLTRGRFLLCCGEEALASTFSHFCRCIFQLDSWKCGCGVEGQTCTWLARSCKPPNGAGRRQRLGVPASALPVRRGAVPLRVPAQMVSQLAVICAPPLPSVVRRADPQLGFQPCRWWASS